MELGKEEVELSENKEQEKISIVVDSKKSDKKKNANLDERYITEKKPFMERCKEEFTSRKFRGGAYSSILIVFILVAVILVNMIVGQFDLQVDVTDEGTYTLTNQTKEVVDGIKDDVTIYYIVENGKEVSLFKNIIEKYAELSSHINVVYKDPILYPNFTTEYAGAGTTVSSNSIVVEDEKTDKYKYIPYNQMYDLDYTAVYNGEATDPTVTAIDVEGQITSALKMVTNEQRSNVYEVTGHGETSASDYLKSEFSKLGADIQTLNIRGVGDSSTEGTGDLSDLNGSEGNAAAIPDDCSILYICGPTTDYTESEIAAIKTYLQSGGKAMVMLNYQAKTMTNLYGLLKNYGLDITTGVVMEDNDHCAGGYPYMSYASITNSNSITIGINDNTNPVFMPRAQGIKEVGRDGVTLQQVLTTSQDAFCKTATKITSYDKEDTDVEGPFDAGVLVSEAYNGKTSEMVVFSSHDVANEEFVTQSNFGNITLLNNTIAYLTGQQTGLSIPKRSMKVPKVNTTDSDASFYTVILVVAIPVILLASGFYIWYRRRRRA